METSASRPEVKSRLLASGCGGEQMDTPRRDDHNDHQQGPSMRTSATTKSTTPLERLFTVILLPFIFVFLLPSLKLNHHDQHNHHQHHPHHHQSHLDDQLQTTARRRLDAETHADETAHHHLLPGLDLLLLRALVRLPLDRLRLQSGGSLVLLAEGAKMEISSKSDLQEEEAGETHMLLLQAPAEHRANYQQQQQLPSSQQAYHHYGGGEQQNNEPHVQAIPHGGGGGPDYGAGDEPSGGPPAASGQGEASVVAESAGGQQAGGSSALQTRSDLPAVRALNVKCEKNHMTVNIVFDRPFYGMVFSKGHYNDQKCVHLPPNSGQTSVNFDIHLGKCGMSSSDAGQGLLAGGSPAAAATGVQQAGGGSGAAAGQQPNGVFIENTIIIQYDPLVQEIYDQARKLRCTWYDYYEKSVTFRPYNVDMLDAVTANFLGDNIQCWMQIQVGKGPWSSEVAGIVKIGQTMTMVLAIKDDENRFDMLVRNCVAHDGKHAPIQLVDEYGCVARPKIMGKFQKVRNFGSAATVVSYAHFQAFKFPDSMSVHFQCVIQVCRYECPEPVCPGGPGGVAAGGELGGPSSQSNGGDYATSGTEMVASGEALPPPPTHAHHFATVSSESGSASAPTGGGYFNSPLNASANHHHHPHHQRSGGANVQLKLDESQGRVQVKLDTSMMAGLGGGNNGRPPMVTAAANAAAAAAHAQQQQQHQNGPLPPHLLHMASNSAERATPLGSSYYRPATGGHAAGVPAASLRQQPATAATGLLLAARAQPQMVAPPGGAQSHHAAAGSFSPQLPAAVGMSSLAPPQQTSRRLAAAYTSRMGDQAATAAADSSPSEPTVGAHLAPYESEYPLSLIASPRGLRLGGPASSGAPLTAAAGGSLDLLALNSLLQQQHHRSRREVSAATEADDDDQKRPQSRAARNLRRDESAGPTSTSVATHRTIQVVSPDDVAFSLLDGPPFSDELLDEGGGGRTTRNSKQMSGVSFGATPASSVCFSTGRFVWGLLVTLGALLASIVIVAYVILKQRSQLEQKLSTVYTLPAEVRPTQPPPPAHRNLSHAHALSSTPPLLVAQHGFGMDFNHQQQQQQQAMCHAVSGQKRRQREAEEQEEVTRRNNYLSRLYSQFAPAVHWRH